MMIALVLLVASGLSPEPPDVVGPALGAAIGASVPVVVGAGVLLGAGLSRDDAAAVTLTLLGVSMVSGGPIGAAIGAAIGTGSYHPLDIGAAAFWGGVLGAVLGIGGGFAVWQLTLPDNQFAIAIPVLGALIAETAGATIATALMVGAVE